MLKVINNIALWINGSEENDVDVWFLPGFAESHLCFREALKHEISNEYRIILFDPPGLGASPPLENGLTIKECAIIWRDLIHKVSNSRKIVLVAHSVSGIIATETASMLKNKPLALISIEGNLTKADAYFSGQTVKFDSHIDFYNSFSEKIMSLVNSNEVPMRYYSSLQFADPKTLWVLGSSAVEYENPGVDFMNLKCPTLYYWSVESTSSESRDFIRQNSMNERRMDGLGHWPMVKEPEIFYSQLMSDVLKYV